MCQAGEDYAEPAPREPPPAPRPGRAQSCVKCKEGLPVVVIRAGDAFCRDCFKALYVHKFRAMLGKNRLIFPGEKVLLAWSGGPSSSSMVWQVLEGLSQDSAKRLRFVPGVVYVDEGAACGQSPEDREKTLAEVKSILQSIGFPWHAVALEEVFGLPPSVLQGSAQEPVGSEGTYKSAVDSFLQQQHVLGGEQPHQPHDQDSRGPCSLAGSPTATQTAALCRLFDSVRTLTAKEELLQTLRTHLILHVARAHGYSKVMTGDSCTRLAIKLMTNLALGRGAFLAWDTGFSDERHGDVVVVRPMRDHTLKEVAFYNRLFAVPSVFTPAIDTKAPDKASIHRLMEAFILRLQTQFPSTVSTVYRTSEKLVKAPREDCAASPSGPRCLLCLCTLDIDIAGLRPVFSGCWFGEGMGVGSGAPGPLSSPLLTDSATAFGAQTARLSQTLLSTPPAEAGTPTGPGCIAGEGQACCRAACRRKGVQAQVEEQLCYGCRVNMRDLPSLDPLPPYILAEAQLRSQRAWVMQEVQEYLIEDSDPEAEDALAQPPAAGPTPPEQGGEDAGLACDCPRV